ncbi:hypothetical protein [Phenylobacterium sp. J367]|uniref:hypothetical protein n=1 Tax=Phenylobacterium sp. J367 TaxID=2898435 RepID=UPI00215185CF|nr:hypothetical protein [Phenylobacterium sp. J367]MCR5881246.1 hypothetical protein [Phenylobacterium sp. J367]
MLSTDHPNLLPDLRQLRYGVMPVKWPDGSVALVLKVTKEAILAARLRGELKVYLFSDPDQTDRHLGIVTASFDDHDEPLTVVTALFDGDELLADVTAALGQAEFDVYFFDEHDRELMGVRVCNTAAGRFQREVAAAAFGPFDLETYGALAERLAQRFAIRDDADDQAAFTLTLGERLYPDDLVLYDTRPEAYAFRDAHQHPAISELVREDPGPPQERDIAMMLGRVFPAESIYLNPFRADTGKELSDVMVATNKVMLFIEAKDSPNTAVSLGRTMDRKRLTIQNQIKKATKQLKRALVYAQGDRRRRHRRPTRADRRSVSRTPAARADRGPRDVRPRPGRQQRTGSRHGRRTAAADHADRLPRSACGVAEPADAGEISERPARPFRYGAGTRSIPQVGLEWAAPGWLVSPLATSSREMSGARPKSWARIAALSGVKPGVGHFSWPLRRTHGPP